MSAVIAELSTDSAAEDVYCDPTEKIEQLPVSIVPLNSLVPGFFLRQNGTDAAHVRLLADAAQRRVAAHYRPAGQHASGGWTAPAAAQQNSAAKKA